MSNENLYSTLYTVRILTKKKRR